MEFALQALHYLKFKTIISSFTINLQLNFETQKCVKERLFDGLFTCLYLSRSLELISINRLRHSTQRQ